MTLAAALSVALAACGSPLPTPTASPSASVPVGTPVDVTAAEATVWQLIQGARANHGLPRLTEHGTLVSIARWRSHDMNGLAYSLGRANIGWNNVASR